MHRFTKYISFLMTAVVIITSLAVFGFFAEERNVKGTNPNQNDGNIKANNDKILLSMRAPAVSAQSAVLIDAHDDTILMGQLPNTRLPMASTTKIMTAIVAIENSDLNKIVKVSDKAVGVEGSSIYLRKEEEIKMEDLLYGLMLESANDAAEAIAIEVAGSVEKFADMMNKKAKELGLKDTHFMNPHGLDHEKHYTTAYELAKIASYALKNETFRKIVSTKKYVTKDKDGNYRVFINHNRMLRVYDGAIGVKTGYTKRSGRTLVSAAERDGLMLVAVTLNDPNDWRDHRNMLDFGFSNYERIKVIDKNEHNYQIPIVGGAKEYINAGILEDITVRALKENDNIKNTTVHIKRFCYAPIKKWDVVGEVTVSLDGEVVAAAPIVALEDVPRRKEPSRIKRFCEKIKSWFD